MFKYTTLTFLALISLTSFGQESVLVEKTFKPNKIFLTQIKTSSLSEIEYMADDNSLEQLRQNGVELYTVSEKNTHKLVNIHNKNRTENGEIIAVLNYEKSLSKIIINGVEKEEESPFLIYKSLGSIVLPTILRLTR